ncbi:MULTISPECIES: hypothetical protein [Gulosibacter]|uniref:hypothetical protein n=1 Tax=Gulosibacter TaxID=256818 RepID=UPI000F6337FB|nr:MULTISPECIES: hypothetical protein [Gulosibacter]
MQLLLWLQTTLISVSARTRDEERGDVPGWILIAIMSAGLVVLIWALAGPLLTQVFEDAVNRVTSNF